jgi:1-acyl-sn-glycerol-3-phosphate acyltransferase
MLGRTGRRRALHAVERWWARGLIRHLEIALDVEGHEHIQPDQAYVVTSLHESFADALALLQLPLDLRFAVRDELFGWPYIGAILRDTGQVEICPEDGMASYLRLRRAAPPVLASGESLAVFPQGSVLGIEIDFRPGPFALALALGYPILPIALTGGHRVWEHPFAPTLRYGQRMSLRILPPVTPEMLRDRGVEALRSEVQQHLKSRALEGEMAAPRRFVPARDGYWDGYAFAIDPAFPRLHAEIACRRAPR